ncbi:PREDICTED: uncharacterized protein LOC108557171 isoform X4 [Nicrophorus vespilloides]|uniref:Uncharacterized protein LOC108557171 isoform X4 n=1 Tax=Nicrophorus vespilloides TaxID=110193 RepID=A0ABM1M3D2_NICVS|nr:PREDICTED: uncharacterized protein LOC108557171 isoform X4 [Nicrophorus vespilloides]
MLQFVLSACYRKCTMQDLKLISDKIVFVILLSFCGMVYMGYKFSLVSNYYTYPPAYALNYSDFILYNSKCRIPKVDPFNMEVKGFYKKKSYVSCSKLELLTYVTKDVNHTSAKIHIKRDLVKSYSSNGVNCCYQNVSRGDKNIDNTISLSKCVDFNGEVNLSKKAVLVKCLNKATKKEVYSNVHMPVIITSKEKAKIAKHDKSSRPLSVLIVGVDSVSRLNMMRDLPKTRSFLNTNGWIEMQGYNKIGDNTFPNLMAILTGREKDNAYDACDPTVTGKLDSCNFIWSDYGKFNYITGYAEDSADISTFNYLKKGFKEEPVDYYYRSFIIASEKKMKTVTVDAMKYCSGPETAGERILHAAQDFAISLNNTPHFGFFWMNSFSHNMLNSISRMDDKLRKFFTEINAAGVTDNSIIIFISDHGLRFGKILRTYTGWLEERLPMFYIWTPPWFREIYPVEYENLQANSLKLTNPYDLHMTLQDILTYSGANHSIVQSRGCPKCKSLFKEIEFERSCEDASIDWHWCSCADYKSIDSENETVQKAAQCIIDGIHKSLAVPEAKKCAKFKVKKIMSSRISTSADNWYKNDTYFLIVLETSPSAIFEATVKYDRTSESDPFILQSGISRLDHYGSRSDCVKKGNLKTICYCP